MVTLGNRNFYLCLKNCKNRFGKAIKDKEKQHYKKLANEPLITASQQLLPSYLYKLLGALGLARAKGQTISNTECGPVEQSQKGGQQSWSDYNAINTSCLLPLHLKCMK